MVPLIDFAEWTARVGLNALRQQFACLAVSGCWLLRATRKAATTLFRPIGQDDVPHLPRNPCEVLEN